MIGGLGALLMRNLATNDHPVAATNGHVLPPPAAEPVDESDPAHT